MKLTAWDLFNRNFKDGDEVVVIDEDDRVGWGRLQMIDVNGFMLVRRSPLGSTQAKRFWWEDIRFMSHDGFPVRQLMGADGSRTIEKEPSAVEVLRAGLRQEYIGIVFGDPFLIEKVSAEVHNPGNDGPEHWMEDTEESLKLVAPDGARALLWELNTVFHVEIPQ